MSELRSLMRHFPRPLVALLIVALSACTPAIDASSTRRECAPPAEAALESPTSVPLRRYFFLIDRSSSYAEFLPEALALLEGTVDALADPNAAFHVSWIGSSSGAPSEAVIPALGEVPPQSPVEPL